MYFAEAVWRALFGLGRQLLLGAGEVVHLLLALHRMASAQVASATAMGLRLGLLLIAISLLCLVGCSLTKCSY